MIYLTKNVVKCLFAVSPLDKNSSRARQAQQEVEGMMMKVVKLGREEWRIVEVCVNGNL